MGKDYKVGYGKPPKHTQFQPGHSGNPAGRPKGSRNLKTDLAEELAAKVQVKEGGSVTTVTKQKAAVKSLVNKALSGDAKSLALLLTLLPKLFPPDEAEAVEAPLSKTDLAILEDFKAEILKSTHQKES